MLRAFGKIKSRGLLPGFCLRKRLEVLRSQDAEGQAVALLAIQTEGRIAPVGPGETEERGIEEDLVPRFGSAVDAVRSPSHVRHEEAADIAAAVGGSVGAVGSHVEPVGTGPQNNWSGQIDGDGVLVEADEVAAGRLDLDAAGTSGNLGAAVAFADALADVIGSGGGIEVSVSLDVEQNAGYGDGHS